MAYDSMTTQQLKALITQSGIPEMDEKQKLIAILTLYNHRRILGSVIGDIHTIREEMNNVTSQYSGVMEDLEDTLDGLYSTTAKFFGLNEDNE
jgi:Tfp pilus assembly ATPase PilU